MPANIFTALEGLPAEYPGMEGVPSPVAYLLGCRSFEQFCGGIRTALDSKRFCPFCAQERSRRKQQALHGTERWMLLANEYPHRDTERMRLIVPRRHLTGLAQLDPLDWMELGELFAAASEDAGFLGGGVMLRLGDPRRHSGTVEHLHFNLIEPRMDHEYRPPFSKSFEEHAQDYARMLGFYGQLRERGGQEWLLSPEGILATQPPE